MEHILTGPYNKPTNNSRRPPRGAYLYSSMLAHTLQRQEQENHAKQAHTGTNAISPMRDT
ncbi:MAG: hypothetical protein ACMX3H_18915 [Sodalis sp. (in: enterobacteria)]|uniref:hypothetical protein n=1 Tax=Sodalis sp. (in: enterobacteria) TaxID=1898979 RepID=UPI0039E24766